METLGKSMPEPPKPSGENWSRVAKAYDDILDENDALNPVGAAVRQILQVVDTTLPFDQASYIIDMGTGSGPLISGVLNSAQHAAQIPSSARIVAADVAQGLLDMLMERKAERAATAPDSVWNRLEVQLWDARDLSKEVADDQASHLVSSYAYMAFRDEAQALKEACRILQPGGLFIETSFGFTEWGHLPKFFAAVRPEKLAPGPGEHWGSVEGVRATLEAAGFKDVKAREYEVGIPCETQQGAADLIFNIFPFIKGFIADMSEGEVAEAKRLMVEYVKERHPEEPLVLRGVGLVGWASK